MASFKPCREIYRPRPARNKSLVIEADDKKWLENRLKQVLGSVPSHKGPGGQASGQSCHTSSLSSDVTGDRNSPISRAKTLQHVLSILNEFKSADDKSLLLDALDASKYLTMIQTMRVVRLLCHKALESSGNAYAMIWLSVLIIEKDDSQLVLESLLTCCREWYGQQEAELRRKNKCDQGWVPFVTFLRELYACLQPKKMKAPADDAKQPDLLPHKHYQCLANLILDCGSILLDTSRANDASYAVHIECIVSTLRCIGVYLEQDNLFKLDQLIMTFRKVLLSESVKISSMSKKNLMEAIECKASNWIFSPNQQVYFFPYTKMM